MKGMLHLHVFWGAYKVKAFSQEIVLAKRVLPWFAGTILLGVFKVFLRSNSFTPQIYENNQLKNLF